MPKKLFIFFLTGFLLLTPSFLLFSQVSEQLHLASWNIRILSDNSRDDSELRFIADIAEQYDLIAIQEARDSIVIDRLIDMMSGEWEYCISPKVGRGVKERYVFLYKPDKVKKIGIDYLYPDPHDLFIREPYIASFQAGEFDFMLVTFHAIFGDSKEDRRQEIQLLPEVVENLQEILADENDIILLGDFNMPPDDRSWLLQGFTPLVSAHMKTTITDTSSYDNIWLDLENTYTQEFIEYNGMYMFDELLFNNDDKAASSAVSDHRPISAFFNTQFDDDKDTEFITIPEPVFAEYTPENVVSIIEQGAISIIRIITHPTEQEAVYIQNNTTEVLNIGGYKLGDKNNPHSFTIPFGTEINPEEIMIFTHSVINFQINNSNEIIYLTRPDGIEIDRWE